MAEKTIDELLHKPNTCSRYTVQYSDTEVSLHHDYLHVDARGATLREAAENLQEVLETARADSWEFEQSAVLKTWKQQEEAKKK